MRRLGRLLPYPLTTLAVTLLWALLQNSTSPGTLALALVIGIALPLLTAAFWPDRPPLCRPRRWLGYLLLVARDIIQANLLVARIVLFRRNSEIRPAFMAIPLALDRPEAITLLAGTITLTPGTLSADLSADGAVLLIHGLDVPDPAAAIADIKQRYEARLLEMFG